MKEVLEEIRQLQMRLINAGFYKIIITQHDFDIVTQNDDQTTTTNN